MIRLKLVLGILVCLASAGLVFCSDRLEEGSAMVTPIEPLRLPAYDRGHKAAMVDEHGMWRDVEVLYKVRSSLGGGKLVADIVRRFIDAGWAAGLPKDVSCGGGLGFHREDFAPTPPSFAIYYAIVNVSKDEESLLCTYAFRSQ